MFIALSMKYKNVQENLANFIALGPIVYINDMDSPLLNRLMNTKTFEILNVKNYQYFRKLETKYSSTWQTHNSGLSQSFAPMTLHCVENFFTKSAIKITPSTIWPECLLLQVTILQAPVSKTLDISNSIFTLASSKCLIMDRIKI